MDVGASVSTDVGVDVGASVGADVGEYVGASIGADVGFSSFVVGRYEAVTPCVAIGLYPAIVPVDAVLVQAFILCPTVGLRSLPVAVTEPQPSKQSGAKGKNPSAKVG